MPTARFTSRTDGPTLPLPTDAFGPSAPIFRLSCSRLYLDRQNSGGPSLAADGTLIVADRQGVFASRENTPTPTATPTATPTPTATVTPADTDADGDSDTKTNPDAKAAPDTGASSDTAALAARIISLVKAITVRGPTAED